MRSFLLLILVLLVPSCGGSLRPSGGADPGDAGTEPAASAAEPGVADLVVFGRVWTGVPGAPRAEAVAVVGDRIAAVGSRREVEAWVGPETRRLDTEGLVTPGFIDAHVHFLTGGLGLASVQLRDADSPEEFVARIRDFARTVPEGTWITNGNWDHERWGGELPHREWIDSVTPAHPVWVNRLDGHMALANTAALEVAGLSESVEDVEGGAIGRDPAGRLTGLFRDNAMALVARAVPDPEPVMLDRALDTAMTHVAARGVTSVHDMAGWGDLAVYRRARAEGRLRTRISLAVPLASWEALRDTVAAHGRGDAWLRIGGLKGFMDGSLGSHTAAFEAPFTDAPGDRGLLVNPPERVYRWVSGADRAGLQVMVHAIGDRANRLLLDIYERVARENGDRDRRFRIEHAQHLRSLDIPRFAELGVVASMQPYHAIDDGRWAEKVIGQDRARTTYAFRSLLDAGATVAFGSDWFVAPPTPLEGIYAAVTRRTLDGAHTEGWVPEQKITVEEALTAYTRAAAFAGFMDESLGTLEAGKLADLTVLDRDLFQVPPEEIRDVQVTATVVAGEVVYP